MTAARGRGDLDAAPVAPALFALALCFFFSGLGSLVLEVVWTRMLRLVFGSTTLAVSTILVAYMAGLGFGGLIGGRIARRLRNGVATYGWIEIAIGVYAAAVPLLVGLLPALNRAWLVELEFWPAAWIRFAVSIGVLLAPTLGMGATLPILVAALARDDERVGASIGLLYGLNTLGAVGGVFLATFVLFPWLGLWKTNLAGAGIDIAVGLVALTWLAGRAASQVSPPTVARAPRPLALKVALAAYALVGFTSLVYEVAWTRTLAMVIGSSIYAFAAMLGSFLTGIALGSLLARSFVDRLRDPSVAYASGILALGVLGISTTFAIPRLPDVFLLGVSALGTGPASLPILHVAVSFATMLPATLVLGALFPILARSLSPSAQEAGRSVGEVYFVNTVGSASGALAAGFLLIPWIGLRHTLVLAALVNAITAAAMVLALVGRPLRQRVALGAGAGVVALALIAAPPPWDGNALAGGAFRTPTIQRYTEIEFAPLEGQPSNQVLMYRDGLNATVTVHQEDGSISLRVNGKPDASSWGDMPTQVLSGQIPLLFGETARDVLVIGYASGVTVGSVATHPVSRIDTVELEPAILEAAGYFAHVNGEPLLDPRVHLVVDDGRGYVDATRERYDVVISEPSNPWMTGVSNLFTREYFEAVRRVLRPGGRMLQWVQLYGMDEAGLASLLSALREVFPTVYAFSTWYGNGDLLLMATDEPLSRDTLPRWEEIPKEARADLQRVEVFSTEDLWSLIRLGPDEVDELIGSDATPNADDNLLIELRAPWTFYESTLSENWKRFEGHPFASLRALRDAQEPLDAERVAALGYSYLTRRREAQVFWSLRQHAQQLGPSAASIASDAVLGMQRGQSDAATLGLLDRAVESYPRSFELRLLRWELLSRAARHSEAQADAETALELRPDDPRPRSMRAISLRDLGRVEEAAAEMDALLELGWADFQPPIWLEAMRTYLQQGRTDDARELLERFVSRDPHSPAEWNVLASVYANLGLEDEATRARRNVQTARVNRARLLHRRARVAMDAGDVAKARRLLNDSLRHDPAYEAARLDLDALATVP